jgi:hypothetical protein
MDSWGFSFLLFFPAALSQLIAGPEGAKNLAGESPPPDSDPFSDAKSDENYSSSSRQFTRSANRRFEFQKSRQLFLRVRNEPLSVAAVRVCDPDRSPVGINR